MTGSFSTEAVVLGSHKLREADRVVTLFTLNRGKVPTVVKGVRKVSSRFGGRLEPFTHLQVQLHEGRNLHTLTGADTIGTHAAIRDNPQALKAGLSLINLLGRETNELEKRPRTFNLLVRFLDMLDEDARSGASSEGLQLLSLAADLKLLLLAGYLPHLLSCSACGATELTLNRFSAQAGGALCPGCPGESFPVSKKALATMCGLLEKPLAESSGLAAGTRTIREIWRAIVEICRYHLGIDLRVEPW